MNSWCVGKVDDMQLLFVGKRDFDEDISGEKLLTICLFVCLFVCYCIGMVSVVVWAVHINYSSFKPPSPSQPQKEME